MNLIVLLPMILAALLPGPMDPEIPDVLPAEYVVFDRGHLVVEACDPTVYLARMYQQTALVWDGAVQREYYLLRGECSLQGCCYWSADWVPWHVGLFYARGWLVTGWSGAEWIPITQRGLVVDKFELFLALMMQPWQYDPYPAPDAINGMGK